ncbi:acetyl-CoA acetyltransferase [Simplicispira suum]|uniref:Acetyl-CoA acetyltransferase n=2 Tax=Simplicispira suum TaxID=2109915 RepID=A0A2S0N578_9BURK|nr:acetyl-CoA acetyltransferase [Simplicispira suum]
MNVHVLGVGQVEPTFQSGLRLEEMAYRACSAALKDACVSRGELDHVTLAACDELDGRPISSMLMTAPSGGYLTDEIKVTDNSAMGLVLGHARIASGDFDIGLVVSWCKSSKTDIDAVMRMRADPFYVRPMGMDGRVADALFAQSVAKRHGIDDEGLARRVGVAYRRASTNPRGMRHAVPTAAQVTSSGFEATPLRGSHLAPATDGAVAMVLASDRYLRTRPEIRPLCRVAGVGWNSDSYRLDSERLGAMRSARRAWDQALAAAGVASARDLDLVELDTPTIFHEVAYQEALGIADSQVSPSGGSFAQNPVFCTGIVNAMEAVLQVSGRAGPNQRVGARRAAAHGCHGYAQQGNVFVVFEGASK